MRSKFVIASRNVCVGPGGPKKDSDEKLLDLAEVQYCPLEEAFVGYVEEGNIRSRIQSYFFNEGRVYCVGVTEMPSRLPGWHFNISDKQKNAAFLVQLEAFFLWRNFLESQLLGEYIGGQEVEVIFRSCDISSPPDPLKP